MNEIASPLDGKVARRLRAGETVWLTGTIFTARDMAHRRAVDEGVRGLPARFVGGTIYHCGPIVRREGAEWRVVSAGPTTSARMAGLLPAFMGKARPGAVIGKGGFPPGGVRALARHGCIYLAMTGGAAALAADMVRGVKGQHWPDLGMAEAVWEMEVEMFGPLVVAIDAEGRNLYERVGREAEKRMASRRRGRGCGNDCSDGGERLSGAEEK